MSATERSRRYRERKRQATVTELKPVPDGPGAVESALDVFLAALDGPDPLLAEVARGLARKLDGDMPGHPATAAELRRTRGQLAKDDAAKRGDAAERPASGGARPVNPVAEMRRSYARRFGAS